MKLVTAPTRAGRDGRDVICPECSNIMRLYSFSFSTITCTGCRSDIDKLALVLPDHTCDKCQHIANDAVSCRSCGKTYHRCDDHGGQQGCQRSLHSHRAVYHQGEA